MSKQSGFLQRQEAYIQQREEAARHHTRVFTLDMVTNALGRMGFREKKFMEFDAMLTQVCKEYADLIIDDAKDDKEMVYAKACLDRELKQYTGSLFRPYEERYG